MLQYNIAPNIKAFTFGRGCHGTEPGIDAREVGLHEGSLHIEPSQLMLPRQTHSTNVRWVSKSGEVPDTDAVITGQRGLYVGVKTADCIPILLYDARQELVAAVHAGWRGTVGRIVQDTIHLMDSKGLDLHAVIGPGISQDAFEVGDEVYEAFRAASFPMQRIALRKEKWHLDLWEANRWLLEECGVTHIHTAGICTFSSPDFYSARRDTIATGRNINCIRLEP